MAKKKLPQLSIYWLLLIQLILGYEWLNSAWEKFTKPEFMDGIEKTIAIFAAKTHYGWYGSFLRSSDAQFFGNLTRFGELLVGLGLVAGAVYMLTAYPKYLKWAFITVLAASVGACLLNLSFYLAAGWSSPSTSGINVVMGLVSAVLALVYAKLLLHGKA